MSSTPDSLVSRSARSNRLPLTVSMLLKMLERTQYGVLTIRFPDGHERCFKGAEPGESAHLHIHDLRAIGLLLRSGDIGVAEAWRDGWLHVDHMTAFLKWCIANQEALAGAFYGGRLTAWLYRIMHALRPNTKAGAKKNIHAHYDLGNAFYGLWLDRSMTYSSADFQGDSAMDLERAQHAKYERILTQAGVTAGDHVLEIGCGWGGFAEYAARTRGCRVTGITISQAQLDYARTRIEAAGVQDKVELRFCDYRDLVGTFDAVISIEMIEAVGERYWQSYFQTIHARLRPGGRAVVQGITIDDAAFAMYRSTSDFIREYIFPGGMLASPERWQSDAERAGLTWTGDYRFGRDYAETLRRWRKSFEEQHHAIEKLGFDARFQTIWRFYLHYCEAGFDAGRTDVIHMHLEKPCAP